jgi:hypothetical protein
MGMSEKTTIQVSRELLEKLKQIGRKGETYEDLIWRLLRHYEKCDKAKKEKSE